MTVIKNPEAGFLCEPSSIHQTVLQTMELMTSNKVLRDAECLHWRMEELGQHYIVSAFKQLGWQPTVGQRITTNELMWGLSIKERYRQLIEQLLCTIAEKIHDQWFVFHSFESYEERLHETLKSEYPQAQIEITLYERCAKQLPAVLTGKLEPLSLLFPTDDQVSAEQLYRDSPLARICNRLLAEILKAVTNHVPPGRKLRILEIGAGTGGATSAILPVLPLDKTEYSYTDISAAFFEKSSIQFKDYDFVSYFTLDIEKDPQSQGFDLSYYDLVIAANVLHSTKDLTQVLGHIQQLLAPKGLLVLQEMTQQQTWLDLTFGLLPGWWKFQDSLRSNYPLINANQWSNLLKSQGFTDVSVLIPHGVRSQAMLIAQESMK